MSEIDLSSIEYVPEEFETPEPVGEPDYNDNSDYQEPSIEEEEPNRIESVEEHQKMVIQLSIYNLHYRVKLGAAYRSDLQTMSMEELEELLARYNLILGAESNLSGLTELFKHSLATFEFLCCNFTPIRAQGLSQLNEDVDFMDDVRLVILQNSDFVQTTPEARIALKILSTTANLHKRNSMMSPQANAEVSKVNDQFQDL